MRATMPGTTTTAKRVKSALPNGFQKSGSSVTRFQTMKSGKTFW